MNSHTTHLSPQATARAVGNDLRGEAWSRMKPRGTRSSEVAAAEELQAFPSSRLFNRKAVENPQTFEFCPRTAAVAPEGAVIPAMVPLQAFQMSSPAYSFHRTVPRAAAVILECELDGDRAINSPGRCRNRRKGENVSS